MTRDPTQESLNAKRALRFISEGQYSRAAQALTSPGMAASSQDNLVKMREKHLYLLWCSREPRVW